MIEAGASKHFELSRKSFCSFGHYIVSEWTVSKWFAVLSIKPEYGLKTVVDKNESKLLCYWRRCAATKAPSGSAEITAIFQGWDRINWYTVQMNSPEINLLLNQFAALELLKASCDHHK